MTIYIRRARKRRANPKKALGRRFAIGDRVRLSLDGYKSKDTGTVIKHLPGSKIRVDYPSRGYQIDAKVNEFMRVSRRKRASSRRRIRNADHGRKIGDYRGYSVFVNLSGTSLSVPSLKLFGFAYESNLKRAVDKELAKRAKRKKNPSVAQGESQSGYKYGDKLAEFLHSQDMDEQQGEADALGWFGFLDYSKDVLKVDDNGKIHTYKAAIVVEYGDGSTDYEVFTSLDAAKARWRRIEKLYDEHYGSAE